jgi:hypothetical protein
VDISDTLAPKSDQLDAVDLLGGPQTFTITQVSKGNAEQPVNVHLEEFPRPWRPGKSMRRVLAACWGANGAVWAGRRVTLFCDTSVKFGGEEVGGTRISHLSHIDKPVKVPLLVTRGKSQVYTVQPLVEKPAPKATTAGADIDALAKAFEAAGLEYPLTEAGNPSFTKQFLEAVEHPLAQAVLDVRLYEKAATCRHISSPAKLMHPVHHTAKIQPGNDSSHTRNNYYSS